MRVRWTLYEMNQLKAGHLKSNVEFWKYDTLFESSRFLQKLDKSIMVKVVGLSEQAKMIFDLARNQQEFTKENIDELINFDIQNVDKENDFVVVFDLFIAPVYFETQQALKNPGVDIRRKLNKLKAKFRTTDGNYYEPTSRQGFIDIFESEIKKYYTKKFAGEILEEDGESLSVMTL